MITKLAEKGEANSSLTHLQIPEKAGTGFVR
jgi:hypothetical protein